MEDNKISADRPSVLSIIPLQSTFSITQCPIGFEEKDRKEMPIF